MEIKDIASRKKYKVVIECSTFNQSNYIEDALKGFLMQRTDFPFCALIIDDCSTDGQQEIIERYASQYPDIIIPIYLPYNHFKAKESKQKYFEPYFRQAEYIAKCEGDDYWIDEDKLQKQADYLDANPDCALTYHACINKFENSYIGVKHSIGEEVKESYSYNQLIKDYHFQTATVMLRSSVWFDSFFQKCYNVFSADYVQYFAASQIGKIQGINKKMSVYRRTNSGISYSIHKGNLSVRKYNAWVDIGNFCDDTVKKEIHRVIIYATLCEIFDVSVLKFIKYSYMEWKKYPSVVCSVLNRICRSRIKRIFNLGNKTSN